MGELTKFDLENVQKVLPAVRDWRKEQDAAAEKKVEQLMETWNKGLSGEALFLARILIQCGLPIKPTSESQVTRTARTGKNELVRVTFSRTDENIPLPYGSDRNMVIFLTTMGVEGKSTLLDWKDINKFLALFGRFERSGQNHRLAQARFVRVAHMNITISTVKKEGDKEITYTIQAPLLEATAIAGSMNQKTGKWVASDSPKKMLAIAEVARIGTIFYSQYLAPKKSVPIPSELVMQFARQPQLLDYALFLFWRCFAGQTVTTITWDQLKAQFDHNDSNPWRWASNFKKVIQLMRLLPHPFDLTNVEVDSRGIILTPYPQGTTFLPDQPKRKFPPSSAGE